MRGVNEDAYWDQFQAAHDPQWPDVEDDFFEDDRGYWDDDEVDEMILERRRGG